jgi:cation transport regulator
MPRKSSSPSTIRRKNTARRGKRTVRGRTNNSSSNRTMRGSQGKRSTSRTRRGSSSSSVLSIRMRKAIDTLPSHAQDIYIKAHKNALKQYHNPSKRRGGKRQSKEQVAHKVAWSAVKKEYKKKGNKWVPKKD